MADLDETPSTTAGPTTSPQTAVAASEAVPPAPRGPSRWVMQVTALTVALIALLALSGLLFWQGRATNNDVRRQAVASSAQAVVLLLSNIGASNAAQQLDSLSKQSTGEFRDQLNGYAAIFQKILRVGNVTSQANVTAAGIERMDADSATVLVAVSTVVTNSQLPAGQPRAYRLAVELQRSGTQWLASKVDYVG
ncbi:MAG: hypothetical protein J2P19_05220 [Pseudonocardia sp.]|nr:hypothetical protein [Pseudonocardia sp.]